MEREGVTCANCCHPWCGMCANCHKCDYAYFRIAGGPLKTVETMGFKPPYPTTQKGKGVLILKSLGFIIPRMKGFIRTEEEAKIHADYPLFARPCPERPRHGFVDSRVVNNDEELIGVLNETLAADPKGEVMLMSPIDAKWNAIWTPTCLTMGKGNDGATAGKDVISLPLIRSSLSLSAEILKSAGVAESEDPYIEIVGSRPGGVFFTQLRAGARMGVVTKNFIPSPVTIKEIIPTRAKNGMEIPLLEWERIMKDASGDKEGVVVYHPGGSFTDHFTVHARTFDIPVVLEERGLKVGETLEKESEIIIPDPQAVLKGVIAGEKIKLSSAVGGDLGRYVDLLLVALHHSGAMGGEFGKWIGIAVALMIRFGMSALAGEARHFQPDGKKMPDRGVIYNRNFPFSLSRHQARVNRLTNILRYGFSGGAVGGEKWARCGASLMPLFNVVRLLARDPSPEVVKEMIRALNVAVNQAHNNGWWLNKFASQNAFMGIQKGNINNTCQAIPPAMVVDELYSSLTEKEITKRITEWAEWDETRFRPMEVKSAEVVNIPLIPGISIRFKSRILGPKFEKEILVPSDVLTSKVNETIGQFYLVEGENGMKIELRKGKEILPIWEEKALL